MVFLAGYGYDLLDAVERSRFIASVLVDGFALLMLVVFFTAHLVLPRQHYFPEQVETGFSLPLSYKMPLCRYRRLWWGPWLVMKFCLVVCDTMDVAARGCDWRHPFHGAVC